LAQLLDQQESASPHEWLSYERAVARYLHLIASLRWRSFRTAPSIAIDLSQGDGHPFTGILESIHVFEPEDAADPTPDLRPIRTSDPDSENYP